METTANAKSRPPAGRPSANDVVLQLLTFKIA